MYIGVDLGTSAIKITLADEKGKILDSYQDSYPLLQPQDQWFEQNPVDWYESLVKLFGQMKKKYALSQIKGISFCGQMHGLVVLDKNNQVIRPTILWNDNRTIEETNDMNNHFGKEKLKELTLNIAYPGFTAPKILWMKRHEAARFNQIDKIMLPKDYLVFKLTGKHVSDVTDLSGTLLYHPLKKDYVDEIITYLGVSRKQLPHILESTDIVGTVTDQTLINMGILPTAKVVIGGSDQAVGGIGTGTVDNENISISLGTSGVVFAVEKTLKPPFVDGIHYFNHAQGAFHKMGVVLSASGALKWFMESILNENDYVYALKQIDKKIPGLTFLPYLVGERGPINDPASTGSLIGLTLIHDRYHLLRAVVEGITFALKDCYDHIKMESKPKFARIIGGGSQSPLWMQMIADIFDIETRKIHTTDGGSLGAVVLALVGCGVYKDVSSAVHDMIKDVEYFKPNPDAQSYYQNQYQLYLKQSKKMTRR